MYITTLGFTLYSVLHICVIQFNLSLHILAIASFILGCCGDFTTFVSCGFAYVADTSKISRRIFRIVLAETLITLSGGPGQIGSGFLIEKFGFEAPYILILVCMTLTSLYLYWLTDSVVFDDEQKGKSHYNPKEVLVAMKELLRPRPDGRLWKLISYNVIVFVYIMNAFGFLGTSVLYITSGDPFCLSHHQVGYYEAAQFIASGLGMLIGGALLPICLSDLTVIQISNVVFFGSLIMTGLVRTETGLYVATVLGLARLLAVPLSRARMSKLVEPSEQGVMFALSGCVQSVSTMVGIPVLQAIFPSTNAIFPGLVFIIMAATVIPPGILTIFLQIDDRKQPVKYESLPSEDEAVQESVNREKEPK
ncbi:putative proton-coupled folate transporter-like [Apostichopus japonicus]|uniref:Proton-coupled folate transporter n=1 Tax=Stichopus japonicus TaxID=307972 RepID=A0A2G8KLK9_STIJA|nr:putative proton-coupled folate transporter-like [Apostichopus japonicus]